LSPGNTVAIFVSLIVNMRKLLFLLLALPFCGYAQRKLNLTLFGGFSNYNGDLQSKRFTTDQSKGAIGAGLRYEVSSKFAVHGNLMYGKVAGDDKRNEPSLRHRNLNFETRIYEGNLLADYTFLDLKEHAVSPYVFAGIALYRFNPYTFDTLTGRKVYLRPLSTEGQGLSQYPDRKPYSIYQIGIPFGAGFRFRITDNATLGYEIGLRKLFTDYIDDVSTTYVERAALLAARGQRAVDYAYRGDELKDGNPNYPSYITVRGGAEFKDWYYFSGITLSIGISDLDGKIFNKKSRKGSVDCPKDVL